MSIINDALKKVQLNLNHNNHSNKISPVSQSPDLKSSQPSNNANNLIWGIAILIGLAILGCVTLIILIASINKQSKIALIKTMVPVQISVKQPVPAQPQAIIPAANEVQPGALVLNGIITSNDEQMALINNQILKAGETIDEKKILSISKDKVEILDNGKVITLTTKH